MSTAEKWHRFRELPENIGAALNTLGPLLAVNDVSLVYLFGSLAPDGQGNDVDLALLTDGRPAFQIRDAITDHLGTERVDPVDLRRRQEEQLKRRMAAWSSGGNLS